MLFPNNPALDIIVTRNMMTALSGDDSGIPDASDPATAIFVSFLLAAALASLVIAFYYLFWKE